MRNAEEQLKAWKKYPKERDEACRVPFTLVGRGRRKIHFGGGKGFGVKGRYNKQYSLEWDYGKKVQMNSVAWKRNEIAWKQRNEKEPIAACVVVGFLVELFFGIYIILYIKE